MTSTNFQKYLETPTILIRNQELVMEIYQPPSPKGEGAEVSKMAIRVWAGGYAHGEGVCGGVCLSVRLSVRLSVTGRTSPRCLDQ